MNTVLRKVERLVSDKAHVLVKALCGLHVYGGVNDERILAALFGFGDASFYQLLTDALALK